MLFAPDRQVSTPDAAKPPFKPFDRVKVVPIAGWKTGLVGKTGTILDSPAIPITNDMVPGNVWLRVHLDGGHTVPLIDTELELLPKPKSALALDICHR